MIPITSRRHPFVARCRALAAGREADLVLLDGPHLVGEALASGLPIVAAAIAPRMAGDPLCGKLAELAPEGAAIYQATAEVMEAASPARSPSGMVAIARVREAPPAVVLAGNLVVAAVGVQDPGNVGAIIRVADAAGATGFAATAGCADPLGWKALRGSMGSAFRVPLASGMSGDALVSAARAAGLEIIATCPAGGTDHDALDLTKPSLFLLGGEGPGLPADLIAAADARVRIPMRGPVESLNVAVATGILLFETRRQRKAMA
ncbi:MAG: RNA methyltransferase [Verrucomicrobia bacterium]|nr:RNA methyltransferase [Verrucomicrobiota bacterium]